MSTYARHSIAIKGFLFGKVSAAGLLHIIIWQISLFLNVVIATPLVYLFRVGRSHYFLSPNLLFPLQVHIQVSPIIHITGAPLNNYNEQSSIKQVLCGVYATASPHKSYLPPQAAAANPAKQPLASVSPQPNS